MLPYGVTRLQPTKEMNTSLISMLTLAKYSYVLSFHEKLIDDYFFKINLSVTI